MIPTVTITAVIPARATYIRHVIEAGHRPGVLSGAELQGKARQYGAAYARARGCAAAIAASVGVSSRECVLLNSRWTRVWTVDGKPVELTLAP